MVHLLQTVNWLPSDETSPCFAAGEGAAVAPPPLAGGCPGCASLVAAAIFSPSAQVARTKRSHRWLPSSSSPKSVVVPPPSSSMEFAEDDTPPVDPAGDDDRVHADASDDSIVDAPLAPLSPTVGSLALAEEDGRTEREEEHSPRAAPSDRRISAEKSDDGEEEKASLDADDDIENEEPNNPRSPSSLRESNAATAVAADQAPEPSPAARDGWGWGQRVRVVSKKDRGKTGTVLGRVDRGQYRVRLDGADGAIVNKRTKSLRPLVADSDGNQSADAEAASSADSQQRRAATQTSFEMGERVVVTSIKDAGKVGTVTKKISKNTYRVELDGRGARNTG